LYHRAPVILAGLLLLGAGQVDPTWLSQWNVALEHKPEVLTSLSRIAAADEPGTPLRINGTVLDKQLTPIPEVTVHAYHRDHQGFEYGPDDCDTDTWRLQGWAITDTAGRFVFDTVQPAADHLGREAAHIHFTLTSQAARPIRAGRALCQRGGH
jgi:protocatechuate 3,4-dioxygenase beta subunit